MELHRQTSHHHRSRSGEVVVCFRSLTACPRSLEPDQGADDDDEGFVELGSFGVAGGEGGVLLEPVQAPLNEVALAVQLSVNVRWPPPDRPASGPVVALIAGAPLALRLRRGCPDRLMTP